jgi:hypothetical protein
MTGTSGNIRQQKSEPRLGFAATAVLYTLVTLGTFYLSGLGRRESIFEKLIVQYSGVILPVADRVKSVKFYERLFDLPPAAELGGGLWCFDVAGLEELCLREIGSATGPTGVSAGAPATVVLATVKSGFARLHAELVQRSGKPALHAEGDPLAAPLESGRVSDVVRDGRKELFLIRDLDGNVLVFSKGRGVLPGQ